MVIPENVRMDASELARVIEQENPKRIFLPFVALDLVSRSLENGTSPLALKEVITAGEQLKITPTLRNLFTRLEDAVLVNQYGPTETHVVTYHTLCGDPAEWPGLPPIGTPIQNARIYILDSCGSASSCGCVW